MGAHANGLCRARTGRRPEYGRAAWYVGRWRANPEARADRGSRLGCGCRESRV